MEVNHLLFAISAASLASCFYTHFIKNNNSHLRDPLTKCLNRHSLKEIEEKEMSGNKYYVIFCDIDFFKKVNDTHGHDAGDLVLATFAKKLLSNFKNKGDYIVRWGGEEFILFLRVSNTTLFSSEVLRKRIDKLRVEISEMKFTVKDIDFAITSSFGISIDTSMNLHDRIKEADANLYIAKKNGRNRIEGV